MSSRNDTYKIHTNKYLVSVIDIGAKQIFGILRRVRKGNKINPQTKTEHVVLLMPLHICVMAIQQLESMYINPSSTCCLNLFYTLKS